MMSQEINGTKTRIWQDPLRTRRQRFALSLVAKPPRPVLKEMKALSADEARWLLEAASEDRLEALYVLAIHTGMRLGELLALRWQDVDLENAVVCVRRTLTRSGGKVAFGEPKTKKSRRSIRLTPQAVEALRAHLKRQLRDIESLGDRYQDQGLVFTTDTGALINPSNLRQHSFASLLKRAGLPHMRFHDLRHTCATLLLSRNVNPKIVSEAHIKNDPQMINENTECWHRMRWERHGIQNVG